MTVLYLAPSPALGARTAHRTMGAPTPRPHLRGFGHWVVTAAVVCEAMAVAVVVTAGHGLQAHRLNQPLDHTGVVTEMLVLIGAIVFIAGRLFLLAALTPKRPDSGLLGTARRLIRIAKGTQLED